MKLPINVVHVPKTAGTSLRAGLVSYLGPTRVLRDYGQASEDTSDLIRRVRHKRLNLGMLREALRETPSALIGHYPVSRYMRIFPASQIVCFLREPVARMFSDYYHTIRHRAPNADFDEFVETKKMLNHMSSYIRGVSWPALGLIGISEHYEESLEFFNDLYGANLPVHRENQAPLRHGLLANRSRRRRDVIEKHNQKDISIYRAATEYFALRVAARDKGKEFVHGCFDVSGRSVAGYAFCWSQAQEPVPLKLRILHKGKILKALRARDEATELKNLAGIPRRCRVGFNIELDQHVEPTELQVIAVETSQALPRLPQSVRVA